MGNAIVIKGADFSAESIGRVTFVQNVWLRNIGDRVSQIFEDLNTKAPTTSLPYYFYGNSSPIIFAGKKISKIVAGFITGMETRDVVIGVCDKNVSSVSDFNNSYVEIGKFTLTNGIPLVITPFTVPEGKTIVYHMYDSTDTLLILDSSVTKSGVSYGVAGLDRIVSNQVKSSETMTHFIDFLTEEEEESSNE